jgi:RsiW-degrading membrane proteinase PrsW (M82 family)
MFKTGIKRRNFLIAILIVIGGMFSELVAGGLNELFIHLLRTSRDVVSPFVEEPIKMTPLLFLLALSRVRIEVKKCKWIFWGALAGLGFAILEALGYVEMGVSPTSRVLVAFEHIAWSGVVSIGFAGIPHVGLKRGSVGMRFKRAFRSISPANFVPFLGIGITLHALWNLRIRNFIIESQFLYIVLCFGILFYLAKLSTKK